MMPIRTTKLNVFYRIPVVSPTSHFANDQFANVRSRFANVERQFANAYMPFSSGPNVQNTELEITAGDR